MASKTEPKKDFEYSPEGVPLGHYGNGSPLPPVPHTPPTHAIPGDEALTDHDFLVGQSGTEDRLREMERPPAQHGKGKDAQFQAGTSLTAPDGPLKDEDK